MIEVKNLFKSYGDIKAVQDISFYVKSGEIYAFLGENGAGKSTTINILCTVLKKDKGEIVINNQNLDKNENLIKKDIGVVFQGAYLDDRLTVFENLNVRSMLYGFSPNQAKDNVNRVADIFDLRQILKRRYSDLSGGKRRRVDIARAMLHEPKILILDEPTTGLDPATRNNVWKTIRRLRKEKGITIFFSTHYMEETENADKISIVKKGKIAVTDTPYMLKQKYSYDSLNLYGMTKTITKYLKDNKYKFKVRNDYIEVKLDNSMMSLDILKDLKENVTSFEVKKGNMDTVFLTVTEKYDFNIEEKRCIK